MIDLDELNYFILFSFFYTSPVKKWTKQRTLIRSRTWFWVCRVFTIFSHQILFISFLLFWEHTCQTLSYPFSYISWVQNQIHIGTLNILVIFNSSSYFRASLAISSCSNSSFLLDLQICPNLRFRLVGMLDCESFYYMIQVVVHYEKKFSTKKIHLIV